MKNQRKLCGCTHTHTHTHGQFLKNGGAIYGTSM